MNYQNFFLYLSAITVTQSVKVLALKTECIIGGHLASQQEFRYQVAIVGRQNYSKNAGLICGGSIIDDFYVISAAQCFIDNDGKLKDISFAVAAGSVDLKTSSGIRIDIDLIYVLPNYIVLSVHDIAVVKLASSFELKSNSLVAKIKLPYFDESYNNTIALVSGYGYNWINVHVNSTGKLVRHHGESDYLLRYAFVDIIESELCKSRYQEVDTNRQICGVISTHSVEQSWGVCTGDAGNPLIVYDRLVGIVSKNTVYCDDTLYGCLYTKVSHYLIFINSILWNSPLSSTRIHQNRPHVLFRTPSNSVIFN